MTRDVPEPTGRIVLLEPRDAWARRARSLAEAILRAAPERVLRVDHIGSTSVPGLPAKDVVDMQAAVRSLDPREQLAEAFRPLGLLAPFGLDGAFDHVPAGWEGDASNWRKLFFTGVFDGGRCNVHVRVAGAANARYPLLFRDYLRADTTARDVWAVFKIRLAEIAENIDEYVDTKDPATDVLLLAAERWALETVWEPPS